MADTWSELEEVIRGLTSLSDIRAAFYSAPRLPLLYAGDRDLQQAIYDAVSEGLVSIVDGVDTEVAVLSTLKNGRVIREQQYVDSAEALEAVGLGLSAR